MDFKTEMAERTAQIEQIIKKYLPKEEGYQQDHHGGDELQRAGGR